MTTDGPGDASAATTERRDYRSLSLGQKIRIAAREDPTKGAFIFLLLLLAFGFLVAFVVVFGGDLLRLLLG